MRMTTTTLLTVLSAGLAAPGLAQDARGFCDGGFALGEADEDSVLTAQEVRSIRAQEFAALDADADGTVTAEEVRACLVSRGAAEVLPRNVAPTGSGELAGSGVRVELEGLQQGALDRSGYMEEAARAFDAAGNEEDNQLEWARAFIVLLPGEERIDVHTMPRPEFAARAAALFDRLDADGDGALTPEEWTGEAAGDPAAVAATTFARLDRDASGGVSADEYAEGGAEQARLARAAAAAAGWEDHGDQAAGIDADEAGEVVSTSSEGLVAEGDTAPSERGGEDAAAGATAPQPRPATDEGGGEDGVPAFPFFFRQGS